MKLNMTILAASLAVFAASSTAAFAVDEHDTNGVKAEVVKTEKAEAKEPVKKHNHIEEKSGMPMHESASNTGKHEKKSEERLGHERHDHTKDRH